MSLKVVIALSGGVDSAIAAFLLKKQGYQLFGVYMQNWDVQLNEENAPNSFCSKQEDLKYVKEICNKLNIPLQVYNFVPEYWENVFEPYLDLLENSLISNPDILCNSRIKFGILLNKLRENYGDDIKIATGHWARILKEENKYYLARCSNSSKDQTYFLSRLTEEQLKYIIFPLQDIQNKEEIRALAKANDLSVWKRKDSMGICFIGKREYSSFITNYLPVQEGDLIDIDSKEILGKHKGAHLYVLHQRGGFALKGYQERYYVCSKDVERNIVYLCRESRIAKYLYTTISFCEDPHWINDIPALNSIFFVKTRHGGEFLKMKLLTLDNISCSLEHEAIFTTSPGQYFVFYDENKNKCLGSAMYKYGK
ncbi:tRNA 2-thiouridine(34) synthase MnmA [Candidatus Mycoplasma haematobovis]|nr:tRNA 2-thiouridine(34) synthase MnmA [Candidatus Mycoplasma haematobovis]